MGAKLTTTTDLIHAYLVEARGREAKSKKQKHCKALWAKKYRRNRVLTRLTRLQIAAAAKTLMDYEGGR